jgi:hypothetical protein
MSETNDITAELLAAIPKQFPNIRLWRNNRAKVQVKGVGGRLRMIDCGINGQADLSGIASVTVPCCANPIGIRIELEIKAKGDRQREAQKNFQAMIESRGGIYVLVHDVHGGLEELRRRLAGMC